MAKTKRAKTKEYLLQSYLLEHQEFSMSFKILLTALVTGVFAVIISILTKSTIEFRLFSALSLGLFFGFVGVGFVMFLYNRKFNNIRSKIESLGD
ncbi:MAG: hypothetical protein COY38_00010 [Candidatus Aenigmarchaeota archaeon CG_4_10_14_0_8_um_filter_37_24]|nr:hypothetical protein [Candidatus Aenigmarchaeota archaeon]OIN87800.1 MAG: hypothetical protein AUJ50_02470 [Candidatus Aenigmarchaeota archaeon CG1_02_38_14]PIV69372.1 MAG: hypothetical protein COS07_01030 [Candidatus Aenigmarchaeota archaeon CG01_land_8_20_14_3_00_37_9]PIX50824.1 MAG: hypothetical protein COZ52_02080 [Candidatus Aenigmarchaeota archaeon CG_4_8_14_3_um_filter_37_24]PIZ36529.1 MAG: hypothetical protein COY38_00010 [Candidatus Aenigmarchaeota archaeon CG_4_10_14_0_8_um_filter_